MLALVNNQNAAEDPLPAPHSGRVPRLSRSRSSPAARSTTCKKAQERAHLLEGLLIAQDNIDEVIHIIRTSYDDAKEKPHGALRPVRRAGAGHSGHAPQGACRAWTAKSWRTSMTSWRRRSPTSMSCSPTKTMLKGVLKDELIEIRDKYGDERKTEIQDVEDEIDIEDLIEEEQCVFTLTQSGLHQAHRRQRVCRPGPRAAWARRASPPGRRTTSRTCSPPPRTTISSSSPTRARSTARRAIRSPRRARPPRARTSSTSSRSRPDERVQAMLHVREEGDEERYLTMVTRNGTVKRLPARHAQEPPQQRHPRPDAWTRATS